MSLVLGLVSAACTKPNPTSCRDGTCTDPALPFCDLDGALAGEAETCIAVACNANEFVACRGDRAITCNATGTDYELELCSGGCNEAAGGCRRCEPNETVCENGQVQTCDADGAVIASETCALGCFEDQPRCRRIDPSNGLGAYVDMVATPSNLDLNDAVILTETGEITEAGIPVTGIPSFLVPAAVGGVPIRVFIVKDVELANVKVFATQNGTIPNYPEFGPALAFVATGTIKITGRVTVSGGAGGLVSPGCFGGASVPDYDDTFRALYPGGGGGGHATAGAIGAEIRFRYAGGVAGGVSGTENLSPLRGGCPGGGSGTGKYGGLGGGALQLSSQQSIEVSAVIDARGATQLGVYGGGAGGGLLLEAATINLRADARLIAIGGAGGSGGPGPDPVVLSDDGLPQPGTICAMPNSYCGNGGAGAAAGIPAAPGVSAAASQNQNGDIACGGGGGGLGRIRLNTPDRTYLKANTVVEAGATSVGTLSTR